MDGGATEHYMVPVYATPSNGEDRFDRYDAQMRETVEIMNGIVHHEASLFDVEANLYVLCEDDEIVVEHVTLPTTSSEDRVTSALADLGYDEPNEKYLVFYDDAVACGCGGYATGNLGNDPASVDNPNTGLAYAIVVNSWDTGIAMHEYGHAMDAVQTSAPNRLTAHCSDGQDMMCYDDRPPGYSGPANQLVDYVTTQYIPFVCADYTHFDCNHEDYFHPNPAPGSYLDTHWNIAAPYNLFISLG